MRRSRFLSGPAPFTLLTAAVVIAAPLPAQQPLGDAATSETDPAAALFDSAYVAWDEGDYPRALEQLDRVLSGRGAQALLPDVAVLTGERYRTMEVAVDGTNPRWSPTGRYAAYDLRGDEEGFVVVTVEGPDVRQVARIEGRGAVFSPSGDRIAWLYTPDPDALAREEAEVRERMPAEDRESWYRQRDALAEARARHSRVRVRELATGAERDVPASEPVTAVVWSGGEAVPWVADPGVIVSPTGRHLVYSDSDGLLKITPTRATGATSDEGRLRPIGSALGVRGYDPAFSADGSTLVFIQEDEGEWKLLRLRLGEFGPGGDLPEPVFGSESEIGNPAVSRDGSVVAFQRQGRENEEVWVFEEGGEARRLTHDVQHDLYPRFLSDDRLLVIKGEGRHRRSYVYPVRPGGEPAIREWVPGLGEGMRLFHNNTVRTVAPEYEWAVSPDGERVLIVAERDGDTISPERGVYLADLGQPVALPEVRQRVVEQLAAERDLRERGRRLFAPIADEVRDAVSDVSLSRIYRYQSELFRFGSKYITQPGNAQAIDYLVAKLRSFGYEPELQWFEPRPGIRSANVIARLPGTVHPDVTYVVGSHFDSTDRGPGADDNTSGTVALLEAARVLSTRPQPATIEFAFFTGEEAGLLGSREFARRAVASGKNVVGALNNDMIGYANDHRLDNTIRYSSSELRDLQHAAATLFTDLILYDAHYYKSTDAHALYDAFGDVIGGIGSYPILASPHYHQQHDVLETINHRLVAEVSKATVASLMRMAQEQGVGELW